MRSIILEDNKFEIFPPYGADTLVVVVKGEAGNKRYEIVDVAAAAMFNRIKELEADNLRLSAIVDNVSPWQNRPPEVKKMDENLNIIDKKTALKPFDLQRALAGDSVVTRDGRPVKIAGHNPDAIKGAAVCGWIEGVVRNWDDNGMYYSPNAAQQNNEYPNCNLFMAPKTRTVWVNLYETGQATHHDSEHEADGCSRNAVHTTSLGLKNLIRLGGKAYPIEITE